MADSFSFRAVTFNAWALPVTIPSQQKRRRLSRLPAALAALDADLIVLQEMFDTGARRRLLRELCPPFVAAPEASADRRILGLVPADTTGGLLVLSRLPVTGWRFIPHELGHGTKVDERLGRKGAMIVHIETPAGRLTVFAVHLYAGTKSKDTRIRMGQLAPLLDALEEEAAGGPVLMAGDINTSPTINYPEPPGRENPLAPEYAALVDAGFSDPLPPNPTPVDRSATWVPSRNRYAALAYQETKTDERYDYLMFRPGATHEWIARDARTVIDAPDGHLSDHVGVLVEVELRGR
ncbi:MAG: endonuclease/exonuclease/phosphatase family protein [Gemmatimonadales bacterium]|jgi:endonuclease/exonuclease/phosphatase family metal-dependent hydrolase